MKGDPKILHRVGKELVSIYADIHRGRLSAWTITNLGLFSDVESEASFPYLDWRIFRALAPRVGLSGELSKEWSASDISRIDANARTFFQYYYRKFCRVAQIALEVRSVKESGRIASWIQGLTFVPAVIPSSLDFEGMVANMAGLATAARRSDKRFRDQWDQDSDGLMTVLLMTATDVEDKVVATRLRQALGPPTYILFGQQTCAVYQSLAYGRVVHARSSAGTSGALGATLAAADVINVIRPSELISVGICFGMKKDDQHLCDVAVSESVFEYERQRVTQGSKSKRATIQARGDRLPASASIVSKARLLHAAGLPYAVHIGPFASGDKLVDSIQFLVSLVSRVPRKRRTS